MYILHLLFTLTEITLFERNFILIVKHPDEDIKF